MKLINLPDNAVVGYLDGRPRDPRVRYTTGMPRGKTYLTPAQRTRRKAEALASVGADKAAEAAAGPTEKPALDSVSCDLINGAIEFGGGLVILLLNIRGAYRDKKVAGVHPWATSFFATWGLWNLFYYPSLGQWWSFGGGVFLVSMNFIWFGQLLYYSRKSQYVPQLGKGSSFEY